MGRTASLIYGLISYAIAMASLVYAVGFLANLWVPKSIDSGISTSFSTALIVNLLLLGLFAVQHSVMARPAFKKWWTSIVPEQIERSTYVLLSGLILWLLFWQWRPMTDVVWRTDSEFFSTILWAIYFIGWAITVGSTFLISHTDLFGLKQVHSHWSGKKIEAPSFVTPLLYKFVRHPLYFGLLLVLWSVPEMTTGRLLFAIGATGYIIIGALLEERDLAATFGQAYDDYRKRVSMLIPWWPRS